MTIVTKVELVVKGRALPYITNEGPFGRSIRIYLQSWELNINDSVRKYYNRSDHLTGSRSNGNKIITKNTYKSNNINPLLKIAHLKKNFCYLEYSCKYF